MARLNPKLVKLHRSYTVEEVACLFVTHRNTVQNRLKVSMEAIEDRIAANDATAPHEPDDGEVRHDR